MTTTDLTQSLFQALAEAERIKPVCETEIDVDDFQGPSRIRLEARGAVHELLATSRTVARLGAVRVGGKLRSHRGRA
jgi:hypothetical protein